MTGRFQHHQPLGPRPAQHLAAHDTALLQSSNLHFRGNSLPLKARINGGLVYLDTLLPTSTGPVLLIHEGDEPQDKDSQSKSKRSKE